MLALALAGVGMYGAGAAAELGTVFHDLTLAPFVAGSLLVALHAFDRTGAARTPWLVGSGGILGFAVGLKYTVGACVPGVALAIVWLERGRLRRFTGPLTWWALGVAAGVATTAGYWMLTLHRLYGNPLGPFFNSVFKSPYFALDNFRDPRFFPRTWLETFFYPFFFRLGQRNAMEVPFQEARFAIVQALLIAAAAYLVWSYWHWRPNPYRERLTPAQGALVAFVVSSYVAWQLQFSIYRYLVPVEILAPLAIYALLAMLCPRPASAVVATLVVLVVVAGTVRAPDLGRSPWHATFFGTAVPPIGAPARALGVIASGQPLGFVVPAFPREMRFVRLLDLQTTGSLLRRADTAAVLKTHRGDIYVLGHRRDLPDQRPLLARHGLAHRPDTCVQLPNHLDPDIVLCMAERPVTHIPVPWT
jgi:hypothetical protein